MEYFKYDYKNVDKNINFKNYDTFLTDMKSYKYYWFDLALMQYDPKLPDHMRKKSKIIIKTQKIFIALPYLIIFPTIYYYGRKNFFETRMINKEIKFISRLFGFLIAIRVIQKSILKYEGDKILVDSAINKLHSI
jgi:hypothetical protein